MIDRPARRSLVIALALVVVAPATAAVVTQRVPDGGIQPQVVVADDGAVHLIYYRGEPQQGDVFYTRSTDGGRTFAPAIRVNQHPGSAIAAGNIRGAHLALGRDGRVHVAWMGSSQAEPRAPGRASPMLYTRLNDAGTAFEPERNLIRSAVGLDGGGTVAADRQGNVWVIWHAGPQDQGEPGRRIWIARSSDDGATFAPESAVNDPSTGCCACCGLGAWAGRQGAVYVTYRSAREKVHRDMYLLVSTDHGATFSSTMLQEWEVGACVMSSSAFCESPSGVTGTWETLGQVYFVAMDRAGKLIGAPIAAPGEPPGRRRYPVTADNAAGETILVWTEGMAWNQGGSVIWQVYDRAGRPTAERGRADGVPTWSLVAAWARADGGFTVVY